MGDTVIQFMVVVEQFLHAGLSGLWLSIDTVVAFLILLEEMSDVTFACTGFLEMTLVS